MSLSKNCKIIVVAVSATAVSYGLLCLYRKWKNRDAIPSSWKAIGEITQIYCYPIKSCGPIEITEAFTAQLGIENNFLRDRVFMTVDSEKRNFLTARAHPRLVLIQPSFVGSKMTLTAPEMTSITVDIETVLRGELTPATVWDQQVSVHDCGDEVAKWFSTFIFGKNDGARLIYFPSTEPTRPVRLKNIQPEWPAMTSKHTGAMHDATSYMLVNEASVEDLNGKLQEIKVDPLWFRPNFVMRGLAAYKEDETKWFKVGEKAVFRNVKPCSRCIFTTINPATGEKDPAMEPLRTLRSYRKIPVCGDSPILGVHLGIIEPYNVKVGDKVYIAK